MKKFYSIVLLTALLVGACGNPEKMKDTAGQISVTCDPSVLTATAGVVKAKIRVNFPNKFFDPTAVLEMLPVLKYNGQELPFEAKIVQGEKVKENYTVIRSTGGSYTQEIEFQYDEKYAKSTLFVRPTLIVKGQRIQFPNDIKAADGVTSLYTLAEAEVVPLLLNDRYQKSEEYTENAEIKFLINQYNVRPSELKKGEWKTLNDFLISTLKSNQVQLKEIQISSYASPDGPTEKNEMLSTKRGKSANDILSKQLAKSKLKLDQKLLNVKHTAEDWEGFQKLMEASNIADKQLILRVLSMYNDPQVREREIKNIAAVYKVIADKVLPELRRSQLSIKVSQLALTDNDIKGLVDNNKLDTLTVEQLLYAASNLYRGNATVPEKLYQYTAKKFGDYRAYSNLGAIALSKKNFTVAKENLDAALAAADKDATAQDADKLIINNNLGYVALLQGKNSDAGKLLTVAGLDASKAGLGYLDILKGEYINAETLLRNLQSFNEALALVLNGKLDAANAVLAKQSTPKAYYLKAVIAARNNLADDVKSNLDKAGAEWKEKAKQSVEFANFQTQLQ
jgi:outer membrane protein OmpA-like peptidoglycan-associated protein